MGVIYKLLPKIKEFLIEQKRKDPNLSCRRLSAVINKKFQVEISKSSINSMIKQAGLSSPIGRRHKVSRRIREADGLGAFLLKSSDLLLGGSISINEAIKNRLVHREDPHLLEALIYIPLFKVELDAQELPYDSGLWSLLGKRYPLQAILSYLYELQEVRTLTPDIFKVISNTLKLVWFIKITLSDNSVLYLDGDLRTVWSIPNIPYDFSSTIYKSRGYINKHISEDSPLILFTAPGYDTPTRDFFDFLLAQEAIQKRMTKITLYGNKMEELETIRFLGNKKRYIIFGIWPWQFERYRKIKVSDEFRAFYFEPLQQDFFIAEAEIELMQPKINQTLRLRGCVLKQLASGKIKTIIATNLATDMISLEQLANSYLNRWPNLEEGFTDFSRKIELYTYTASSRKTFSTQELILGERDTLDIKSTLDFYLRCLDLFLRWHILPSEYEGMDFSTTKERFYHLKAKIKAKKDYCLVSFIVPEGYSFQRDLAYACHRLNEKEIMLSDRKRLWFVPPAKP